MLLTRFTSFVFFILISKIVYGCDFHDFDTYQLKLTAKEVEWKIKTFLEKDPSIENFYHITPQCLYIGDFANQQIDYILKLKANSPLFIPPTRASKSFNTIKIAIDPGHFGGSFADLEERFVAIPAEMTKNTLSLRFQEGDLTFLTALELKHLLENEGATVFLTRSSQGQGAIKTHFFDWLKTKMHLIKKDASLSQLFRKHYNSEDLKERAQVINAFCPDLTVVIHYNAHLTEEEKKQKSLLTKSNYNLAFIPGAFSKKELNTPNDRYAFLRLIVTDQLTESLKLSEQIVLQFVKQLNVPLISQDEKTSYIQSACLFQKPGVYSRNLGLTRLVESPICYGETLVQNNQDEIYNLSTLSCAVEGIPCPKRVKEVARAYYEGIKAYLENN